MNTVGKDVLHRNRKTAYLMTQCEDINNEKQIKALYYTYSQICHYHCILSMNLTCERQASMVDMSSASGDRLFGFEWHL